MRLQGYNVSAVMRNFHDVLVAYGLGKYQVVATMRNGHYILKPFEKGKPPLYVIYKRDWFMKFESQFPEFVKKHPELGGLGESINKDCLLKALHYECDHIIFIHPDEVFVGYSRMIYRFCQVHGLIRSQNRLNAYMKQDYSGGMQMESEQTYSFPKSILKTFEEVFSNAN